MTKLSRLKIRYPRNDIEINNRLPYLFVRAVDKVAWEFCLRCVVCSGLRGLCRGKSVLGGFYDVCTSFYNLCHIIYDYGYCTVDKKVLTVQHDE